MTVAYCLDSDVIIWLLRKGGRNEAVTDYLKQLATTGTLSCSALSVAEVERGMRPAEERQTRQFFRSIPVHSLDQSIAEQAGTLSRELRSRGRTIGLADALIAATCLVRGATLVTLNFRDFEQVPELILQTVP